MITLSSVLGGSAGPLIGSTVHLPDTLDPLITVDNMKWLRLGYRVVDEPLEYPVMFDLFSTLQAGASEAYSPPAGLLATRGRPARSDTGTWVWGQYYSLDDGQTWTAGTNAPANTAVVCWDGSKFVSVGTAAAGNTKWSVDGITWTNAATAPPSSSIYDITYHAGLYVVVVSGSGSVSQPVGYRTADPVAGSWTAFNIAAGSGMASTIPSICAGNGMFLRIGANNTGAGGATSASIYTSTDAITWTARGTLSGSVYHGCAFGRGVFVVGDGRYTTDGVSLSAVTPLGDGAVGGAYLVTYHEPSESFIFHGASSWNVFKTVARTPVFGMPSGVANTAFIGDSHAFSTATKFDLTYGIGYGLAATNDLGQVAYLRIK